MGVIKPRTAQATGVNVYLIPGQVIELYAAGYFIRTKSVKVKEDGVTKDVSLINGFRVLDEKVGTIEQVADKAAVIYKHKKAEANTIVFYARTGEVGFCNVISVPIHDHSTIVQGGPALATYFSDDQEDSE